MSEIVRRLFVEKKKGFDVEARKLYQDLKQNLNMKKLTGVRLLNRYDIAGISGGKYQYARITIFSEPPADMVYDEEFDSGLNTRVLAIELLPGQYDQRADSASQCVQILTQGERPEVKYARIIVLEGDISDEEYKQIKQYCINPIETREASLDKPLTLEVDMVETQAVKVFKGFIYFSRGQLEKLCSDMGLAMSINDIELCQAYFKDIENRDPTITEIKMLDTYWSDHCRHTTFLTAIENIEFQDGPFSDIIKSVYKDYLDVRKTLYKDKEKDICLMDLAVIAMKELRAQGKLEDIDISDENNACSINVSVDVDGQEQEWLIMFKNETHNHPTEIEPFGGAATCLGGAIRDPLSGRTYVYQAMRVTGSGDPRTKVEDTIAGKLPQRKIATEAAAGYSSYGNQIGLATGHIAEIYDDGYIAKRMEIGAVIGAAPKKNVVRKKPVEGDAIILLGGRTGRDGCGGATGSSKEHNEESLLTCGAEVQKGNAPTERKLQRLFRNPVVSTMIKKCNDFGAGGVSVAIGELADGVEIDLDAVPKKYDGLDGTELAISESQERMAVVVASNDTKAFIEAAESENLEATIVARVTADNRIRMIWKGKRIVDISRDFLNTNGAKQTAEVIVRAQETKNDFFNSLPEDINDLEKVWLSNLERLNVCSQKGLVERFDSTIGAGTVIMPFGGKHQLTPAESMTAKVPVLGGKTHTATIMSYGYNPSISKWSPFHGAVYAIIEAVAKIVAAGGDYKTIRLTLQEYFEKLGKDSAKWGKPFSALLGAYYAQMKLGIPAIGGKDSMSGTFKDINVPPTLVAFGVNVANVNNVISPEFKKVGSKVVVVTIRRDKNELPDFELLDRSYSRIRELILEGKVISAHTVKAGGVAEAISKMCFGNRIGFNFEGEVNPRAIFAPDYGSIVLEISPDFCVKQSLEELDYKLLGFTKAEPSINVNQIKIDLDTALDCWQKPLEKTFPTKVDVIKKQPKTYSYERRNQSKPLVKNAHPRVFIPIFPGTNCEYDTVRAFEKAGAIVKTQIFRNLSSIVIKETIEEMVKLINDSQIIMIPGGFSGGDEPDGSGKFIATAFRNPAVKDEVMNLLKNRDGLILGICNGFQALIKLGLVPYGEIRDMSENSPTLTFNTIGRHQSKLVDTKIVSTLSPWLSKVNFGETYTIPVSHGEGRFVAKMKDIEAMAENGQIATQYVDLNGNVTNDICFNPNGSIDAIEGITSPDGRVFGKMAHSERIGSDLYKNVPGEKDQRIFEAGVEYFR